MKKLIRLAAVALVMGYALIIYKIPPEERMMVSVIVLALVFGLVLLFRRTRGEKRDR